MPLFSVWNGINSEHSPLQILKEDVNLLKADVDQLRSELNSIRSIISELSDSNSSINKTLIHITSILVPSSTTIPIISAPTPRPSIAPTPRKLDTSPCPGCGKLFSKPTLSKHTARDSHGNSYKTGKCKKCSDALS